MNVTATIPDDLSLHAGEEIQFQALVQADGTFLVTRMLHRETPKPAEAKPLMSLSDWVRKWGGKFKLPEGKNFDDIRRDAVRKKHGV